MSVSGQTWAEPHHQEAAEQYRQLFEDAPIAYHELNTEGVIQRVNNAECRMLEYSREEMLGRHICDFVAPQDSEKCRNSIGFKMSGKKLPGVPFVRAYRTKNNREIIVEIHEQFMRDSDGNIIGMRSALLDVTDRIEAEYAFRSDQRWLGRVFYALNRAVVVVDAVGTVKLVNPRAEKLLGWSAKDLVGAYFREKFPATFFPADGHSEYSHQVALTQPWHGTVTFLTSAEKKQELCISTSPVLTNEGECIGSVMIWKPLQSQAASRNGQGE